MQTVIATFFIFASRRFIAKMLCQDITQHKDQERLELELMNKVLSLYNPADFARIPRLQTLLQTAQTSIDKCMGMFWGGMLAQMMCVCLCLQLVSRGD